MGVIHSVDSRGVSRQLHFSKEGFTEEVSGQVEVEVSGITFK